MPECIGHITYLKISTKDDPGQDPITVIKLDTYRNALWSKNYYVRDPLAMAYYHKFKVAVLSPYCDGENYEFFGVKLDRKFQ